MATRRPTALRPLGDNPAATVRALKPLDISADVAAGVDTIRAAVRAVRAHPVIIAAGENYRPSEAIELINARARLVERTVVGFTLAQRKAGETSPF
jgi:hypothetical protein